MKTVAALSIAATAALLSACGSDSDNADAPKWSTAVARTSTTAANSSTNTAPAAAEQCYQAQPANDPELETFTSGLQLPAGVHVVTGRISKQSDKPGLVGVAIDLCVPGSKSVAALRPIATDIAKALKGTDLGARTFALYVADMDANYKTDAKIKDPDFQLHLWNGKPSPTADLEQWVVVAGN